MSDIAARATAVASSRLPIRVSQHVAADWSSIPGVATFLELKIPRSRKAIVSNAFLFNRLVQIRLSR
jgi:hypothetical protein